MMLVIFAKKNTKHMKLSNFNEGDTLVKGFDIPIAKSIQLKFQMVMVELE